MMRSRRIAACLACLPILLLLAPAAQAQKVSFSCDGATRLVDRMICISGPLNSADHALAQRYKEAMAALRDALRAKQRQWLAERDRRCIGTLPLALAQIQTIPDQALRAAYLPVQCTRDMCFSDTPIFIHQLRL